MWSVSFGLCLGIVGTWYSMGFQCPHNAQLIKITKHSTSWEMWATFIQPLTLPALHFCFSEISDPKVMTNETSDKIDGSYWKSSHVGDCGWETIGRGKIGAATTLGRRWLAYCMRGLQMRSKRTEVGWPLCPGKPQMCSVILLRGELTGKHLWVTVQFLVNSQILHSMISYICDHSNLNTCLHLSLSETTLVIQVDDFS